MDLSNETGQMNYDYGLNQHQQAKKTGVKNKRMNSIERTDVHKVSGNW